MVELLLKKISDVLTVDSLAADIAQKIAGSGYSFLVLTKYEI